MDLHQQLVRYEIVWDVTRPNGPADRHVQQLQLRYLFRFEAEHLLARAGFAVQDLYADYERRPYGSVYPGELVFVAKKAAAPEAR